MTIIPVKRLTRYATGLIWMAALGTVAAPVVANNMEHLTERYSVMSRKAHQSLLTDVITVGNKLVVVGERGHILISEDEGASWKQAKVPTQNMLTAVHFPTPQHGWAVGHEMVILHTSDGGANWEVQYADPLVWGKELDNQTILSGQPFLDVWFRSEREGFAVGAYGAFMYTQDGGATWENWAENIDNIDGWHLNAINSADGELVYIAGEAGTFFRSTDGGQTWETPESPYEGSFFGVTPGSKPDDVWLYGLQGHIFHSTDRGDSWQEVMTENSNGLMSATLLGSRGLVLVGNGGTMLSSGDAGESFTLQTVADRQSLVGITTTPSNKLVMVGKSGVKIADPKFAKNNAQ